MIYIRSKITIIPYINMSNSLYECECGSVIKNKSIKNHLKTKKHIQYDLSNNDISFNDIMKCSCGHTMKKQYFKEHLTTETHLKSVLQKTNVNNEQFGITMENAICSLFNIPFQGSFKYDVCESERLMNRIQRLRQMYPKDDLIHNGGRERYDFESRDGVYKLSVKTTKKSGKVCPQVIGQTTKKKFCAYFSLPSDTTPKELKSYIVENITMFLKSYVDNTFDSPILYYNQDSDKLHYIQKTKDIHFDKSLLTFSHILKERVWKESTTLKYKDISIGEFQFHTRRDNIKFRWNIENVIHLFYTHFNIEHL